MSAKGFRFDPARLPYQEITVPAAALADRPPDSQSSYAAITAHSDVQRLLEDRYGRAGLALKFFPMGGAKHPGFARWGGVPLGDASMAQNLVALDGLAPRVYGLACVNGSYAAQITEYVEDGDARPRVSELMKAFGRWGIATRKNWDVGGLNWRDGLFCDFSGLTVARNHVGRIVTDVQRRAMVKKGKPAKSAYQEVPELKIPGDRTDARGLPTAVVALGAANVLDIGCNLGHFLRLAERGGARRVVGVDRGETAALCRLVNVLTGAWGADVVDARMPLAVGELPGVPFDLAVCLSAVKYLGTGAIPWLVSLAPALWIEGHGDVDASAYIELLRESYEVVERLPDAVDNKRRAQFLCTDPIEARHG